MTTPRFEDGAAYDRAMGQWSRLVGPVFLDWLALRPGLRWIDVGCGSGAFTRLIAERCGPAEVQGIDPAEEQLNFARTQPAARPTEFRWGDATSLPFPENSFDAAVMALVIFFLPDPARGVAEMVRAVRPGGMVATYAWDMLGGGFPFEPILVELRALEISYPQPPSADASRINALKELWEVAGLEAVETQEIRVQRTFASFEEFWMTTVSGGTNVGRTLSELPADTLALLKQRVQTRLPADAAGRITYGAHANAVKGRVRQAMGRRAELRTTER